MGEQIATGRIRPQTLNAVCGSCSILPWPLTRSVPSRGPARVRGNAALQPRLQTAYARRVRTARYRESGARREWLPALTAVPGAYLGVPFGANSLVIADSHHSSMSGYPAASSARR